MGFPILMIIYYQGLHTSIYPWWFKMAVPSTRPLYCTHESQFISFEQFWISCRYSSASPSAEEVESVYSSHMKEKSPERV